MIFNGHMIGEYENKMKILKYEHDILFVSFCNRGWFLIVFISMNLDCCTFCFFISFLKVICNKFEPRSQYVLVFVSQS